MGLRIIDRAKGRTQEVSEAECLSVLTAEAGHWAAVRGQRQALDIQRQFIDNFRRVKAQIDSPEQMAELAARAAGDIRGLTGDGATAHGKVDVATLLELL